MKRIAALVVLMSAMVALAQESVHQQRLQEWAKDFEGEWVSEIVLEDDAGPMKKGTKSSVYLSYDWSPDKEALFLRFWAEADGKKFNTTKGIVGWDASKNAVVVRWFNSLGANGEFSFVKKGQNWISDWTSTDAAGKRLTQKGTGTVTPDSQHWHDTDRKIDGTAQPDSDITWKRKP